MFRPPATVRHAVDQSDAVHLPHDSHHGGGQSASRARGRVLALTIAYVLGLSLAYAALGLLAGLTGTLFGGISTDPWLLIATANLLLLFALMMLDVLPVPVPQSLLARRRHGWEWTTSWRILVYTGVGPEQDIDAAVKKALPAGNGTN